MRLRKIGTQYRAVIFVANKLLRLARTNKTTFFLATAAVDAFYLAKKWIRGGGPGDPPVFPAANSKRPELTAFDRYKNEFATLKGHFSDGAMVTWDILLSRQVTEAVAGDLLEIGVFSGKSATLIALHARATETVVLVDPILQREAIDAVEIIHPTHNILIRDISQNIRNHDAIAGRQGRYRWIHIDGEHSGPAVTNDLEIAETLLAPRGIISVDDFFTPAYPQVTAAVFAFLATRRQRLQLFLCGYTKGYICRREDASEMLAFLRDKAKDEYDRRNFAVTIWKTSYPADLNCFGVTPRRRNMAYRGPDWEPDTIPI